MKIIQELAVNEGVAAGRVERLVRSYFDEAGIQVNGSRAWDLQILDQRFFGRVLDHGSMGLGEAYMDGWWECEDLPEMFRRLIPWRNAHETHWRLLLPGLALLASRAVFNLQSRQRARLVVDAHYDLPLPLFQRMLGPTMTYSCADWRGVDTLDAAQRQKLDLVCRKLDLKPSDRLLDLGCGFGALSKHAAEHYGCQVVGVTLSRSQGEFARRHCAGLPVEIHVCDYRNVGRYSAGRRFDKIASVAMFEAIGRKNFRCFMRLVHDLLADAGCWLLHTLGSDRCATDPWLSRYIFPNGELPSFMAVERSIRKLFRLQHFENLGVHYPPTLAAWRNNFVNAWTAIHAADPARLDGRFYRMWTYYLDCCRGSLLARNIHVWHFVMSKEGRSGAYQGLG